MKHPIQQQLNDFKEQYAVLCKHEKYSRVGLFCGYLINALIYGSSAIEYFKYEFYDKKAHAKKRFVCHTLKKKFFRDVQDYSKAHIFNNKVEFLQVFKDFIGREWLDTATCSFEEFNGFCDRNPMFIAKPKNLSWGRGVHKEFVEGEDRKTMFDRLKKADSLIEEPIQQHHLMATINPGSVNTCRVATIYKDGKVQILAVGMRCGNGDGGVDNVISGGMAVQVQKDEGIVISHAVDRDHNKHYKHPSTGTVFYGFRIPNWDKVMALVDKAARVVPGVGYTGWDVAIRENDAVLIEGNFEGMFDILQYPGNQGIKADLLKIWKGQ